MAGWLSSVQKKQKYTIDTSNLQYISTLLSIRNITVRDSLKFKLLVHYTKSNSLKTFVKCILQVTTFASCVRVCSRSNKKDYTKVLGWLGGEYAFCFTTLFLISWHFLSIYMGRKEGRVVLVELSRGTYLRTYLASVPLIDYLSMVTKLNII